MTSKGVDDMEILKAREEPLVLTALIALNKRMALSYEEKQSIINMEKGFIGEVQFDRLVTECIGSDCVVLQDLLLRVKGNSVQIDSLILTPDVVYLYEIKNYEGDYMMKSGKFFTLSSQEISNPLTQLNRTSSLLRQLFQSWNINMTIESRIVFVNPSFMLYHAKPEDPIIFLGQIKSHFSKINHQQEMQPGLSKRVSNLAKKLTQQHKSEVPFQKQLPLYEYEGLKKGLICRSCGSFEVEITQRSCGCSVCQYTVSTDEAVLSQIEEFKLLFPNNKVTVKRMYDWCKEGVPSKRIRKTLVKHYKKTSLSTGTYYK